MGLGAGDRTTSRRSTSLDWQVHVYGEPSPSLAKECSARSLPLHAFAWSSRAADAKLEANAAYLVRPDGYVGFADASARSEHLQGYLDARDLRP